jgi:hypothetical protein
VRLPSVQELRQAYELERSDAQRFGLGLALLFSVLTAAAFFRGRPELVQAYYPAAIILVALALLFPLPLWPLQRLAAAIIKLIAWLNTKVTLALTFYLLFTPIALFLRIIGKDMLDRKIDKQKDSYWIQRQIKEYSPQDDEKQF